MNERVPSIRLAAVQLGATENKERNVEHAIQAVRKAADGGAQCVLLPEYFNLLTSLELVVKEAEPIPGPTSERMAKLAGELGIWLAAGTICERDHSTGNCYNSALVFSPQGDIVCRYRKIHLFDIDLPGTLTFRESDSITPGEDVASFDMQGVQVGLATCYDLRFPELFRRLTNTGAELVLFPSAFAQQTGAAHWEALIRARAIENQLFFAAANQKGFHTPILETYGHSMIVDPWGKAISKAKSEPEAILVADLSFSYLQEVRAQLPCLQHRRL